MNWLYVAMFVSLWSLGIFIMSQHFRQNLWAGLSLLCGGTASFAFSVHLTIVPFLQDHDWLAPWASRPLYLASVFAMTVYFYLFPYVFCISGLRFGAVRNRKIVLLLTFILALPPAVLLGNRLLNEAWNSFTISSFRWWSGLLFGLGCCLYLLSWALEKEYYAKRAKRRVALLFSAAVVWAFTADFLGFRTLKLEEWRFELASNEAWKNNVFVILGLVGAVMYYTIKYGFLGIKLRIERERLHSSMRALTMGVSILNHSIKNEIQKISYLAEKTNDYIVSGQTEKSKQTIEQVHKVARHMLMMVSRIKEKADDIELIEKDCDIDWLLDSVAGPLKPQLEGRGIGLQVSVETHGTLRCDPVHLKETLSNLLHNGADAVPEQGGELTVRACLVKKHFVIEVCDNGCGIPKDRQAKIFEPFYTTKKNALSFGLGLSYCAAVMHKHKGDIAVIESEAGKGTAIGLYFPLSRFRPAARVHRYAPGIFASAGRRFTRF
ncbi:sensor histidine kinase [Paenibacillus thailandensis]|uniref:histidine kinase n=1 Tax=Paenibacillus thailandensis TaxID=393250 RepID=A0ABW5QSH8_9BACL